MHSKYRNLTGTRIFSKGNVLSDHQWSSYVRSQLQTACNGYENEPGRLQTFDIKGFPNYASENFKSRCRHFANECNGCIGYIIRHFNGGTPTVVGYIITDKNYKLLWSEQVGRLSNYYDVMTLAKKELTA